MRKLEKKNRKKEKNQMDSLDKHLKKQKEITQDVTKTFIETYSSRF